METLQRIFQQFGVEGPQILTHVVGFLLVLWLLRRVAWKPLLTMLDARRQHIEQRLTDVERAKVDIARLQEEYVQRLASVEETARTKLREATLDGKRIAMEIHEQARAEARQIVEEMKAKLHLEVAQANVALRDRIAELVVEATERLLRTRLDTQQDQALVTQFLDELEAQR